MAKAAVILQNFFVLDQVSISQKHWLRCKKAVKRLCNDNFLLSIFIAFFIVFVAAQVLNFTYRTMAATDNDLWRNNKAIYMMEKG